MLTPFVSPAGSPLQSAMLEQFAFICTLYWNDRSTLEQILGVVGGGEILAFHFNDVDFPPSYVVIKQGLNIYVCFTGTVNFQQWMGDFYGALGSRYGTDSCYVHSFFLDAWQALKDTIWRTMPNYLSRYQIHFSGHSYGSAVAFLGALDYVKGYGSGKVSFMGHGGPKVLTYGYSGNIPTVCLNLIAAGDAVGLLPPRRILEVLWAASLPTFASVPAEWTHYGKCYEVSPLGILSLKDATYFDDPNIYDLASVGLVHPPHKYMERWIAAARS